MRFAISVPQFYGDGEFDPAAFAAYCRRAEELGRPERSASPRPRFGFHDRDGFSGEKGGQSVAIMTAALGHPRGVLSR